MNTHCGAYCTFTWAAGIRAGGGERLALGGSPSAPTKPASAVAQTRPHRRQFSGSLGMLPAPVAFNIAVRYWCVLSGEVRPSEVTQRPAPGRCPVCAPVQWIKKWLRLTGKKKPAFAAFRPRPWNTLYYTMRLSRGIGLYGYPALGTYVIFRSLLNEQTEISKSL